MRFEKNGVSLLHRFLTLHECASRVVQKHIFPSFLKPGTFILVCPLRRNAFCYLRLLSAFDYAHRSWSEQRQLLCAIVSIANRPSNSPVDTLEYPVIMSLPPLDICQLHPLLPLRWRHRRHLRQRRALEHRSHRPARHPRILQPHPLRRQTSERVSRRDSQERRGRGVYDRQTRRSHN